MSIKNGTTLTHEAISYLCGLIRDISGLDTNLIDDINIKSNGSWSSVHTKNMIDQSLTDSKEYVDKLIGALNKLSSKKTTVQPTLNNSEFNVIYLYSSSGSAPFDQYLKIGTNDSDAELVSLGSTNIDLTDYLTITDAVATYCKKTDFDTLKTEVTTLKTKVGTDTLNTTSQDLSGGVNELKTVLTTHTSDTDIHVTTSDKTKWNNVDNKVNKTDIIDNLTSTNTDKPLSAKQGKVLKGEVDKKANDNEVIKKTAITTTINSASTDSQVPSAKDVYDLIGKSCINMVSYHNCTFNNGILITVGDSTGQGIIFQVPVNAKTVEFDIIENNWCQFGLGYLSCSLPSLITAGTNRRSFQNLDSGKTGTYKININGELSYCYIGGKAGLKVKNIHVSEWC